MIDKYEMKRFKNAILKKMMSVMSSFFVAVQ